MARIGSILLSVVTYCAYAAAQDVGYYGTSIVRDQSRPPPQPLRYANQPNPYSAIPVPTNPSYNRPMYPLAPKPIYTQPTAWPTYNRPPPQPIRLKSVPPTGSNNMQTRYLQSAPEEANELPSIDTPAESETPLVSVPSEPDQSQPTLIPQPPEYPELRPTPIPLPVPTENEPNVSPLQPTDEPKFNPDMVLVEPSTEPTASVTQPLPAPEPLPTLEPLPTTETLPTAKPLPTEKPLPQPLPTEEPLPTPQPLPIPKPFPVPQPLPTPLPLPQPLPVPPPIQQPNPQPIPGFTPILGFTAVKLDGFVCSRGNGYYAIPEECDNYVECQNDMAWKFTCPDGLYFNPAAKYMEYPCAYPSEVKCVGSKQIAQPTSECPRRYGFFLTSDGDCSKYLSCTEGKATVMNCPLGLVFNEAISSCDWPENVPLCNTNVFKDFTCPAPPLRSDGTPSDLMYKYRYGSECRTYIACQRGHPRLLRCDIGLGFDENSQSCIDSSLVTYCATFYK